MITSPSNEKIKAVVQLQQKAKARREEKAFVAEGLKMFQEAPVEQIREVYISESVSVKGTLREKWQKHPHEIVSDAVFRKMSDTQTPQGILCVLHAYCYTLEDIVCKEAPLLILLEDIQDPGNLGTILRAGEGAGVTGVIMSKNTADIYNPKTIRATMGSIYRMPFFYAENLQESIRLIQKAKIKVYAAHLEGAVSYEQRRYKEGAAFLIGNEGNGLTEETAACADERIKIPMAGKVESLNAAVAAGVLLYEAARQRRTPDGC